jgi:hypothetical protein
VTAEATSARPLVVERRGEGLWCYSCGSHADTVYEVRLVCPYCTAEIPVRLCPSCAKKLLKDLFAALAGLSPAEERRLYRVVPLAHRDRVFMYCVVAPDGTPLYAHVVLVDGEPITTTEEKFFRCKSASLVGTDAVALEGCEEAV